MAGTTWIVYKADSKDAPQWEELKRGVSVDEILSEVPKEQSFV